MIENLLCNYIPFFLCNISQESLEKTKLAELLYSLHEKGKEKLSIEQPQNSSCLAELLHALCCSSPQTYGHIFQSSPFYFDSVLFIESLGWKGSQGS